MVFNVTFNNISVISWRLLRLVEKTRVHGENEWEGCEIADNLLQQIENLVKLMKDKKTQNVQKVWPKSSNDF